MPHASTGHTASSFFAMCLPPYFAIQSPKSYHAVSPGSYDIQQNSGFGFLTKMYIQGVGRQCDYL